MGGTFAGYRNGRVETFVCATNRFTNVFRTATFVGVTNSRLVPSGKVNKKAAISNIAANGVSLNYLLVTFIVARDRAGDSGFLLFYPLFSL